MDLIRLPTACAGRGVQKPQLHSVPEASTVLSLLCPPEGLGNPRHLDPPHADGAGGLAVSEERMAPWEKQGDTEAPLSGPCEVGEPLPSSSLYFLLPATPPLWLTDSQTFSERTHAPWAAGENETYVQFKWNQSHGSEGKSLKVGF
jgi:hypothetical protein